MARFPRRTLRAHRKLSRIHRAGRGPWWFSHDGSGRFDLVSPKGTCYLAEDPLGSLVEVFRWTHVVTEATVAARRLSTLHAPADVTLADCTSPRAREFGLTAAVHSSEDYEATREWADAFAQAGFGGVRYLVSQDPAQRSVGVALFGPAGAAGWPVAATEPIRRSLVRAAHKHFGIIVLPTP